MGGQKGTSANRDRLKELSDMVRICTSQIRRCLHVQENHKTIIDTYRDEQGAIECKILEVNDELQDAPAEIAKLRRQLDKFRTEQDKITGHVTGRTKLVEKYKNTKAKLEKLEAELSDSGFDVGDILTPDEELEDEDTGDKPTVPVIA